MIYSTNVNLLSGTSLGLYFFFQEGIQTRRRVYDIANDTCLNVKNMCIYYTTDWFRWWTMSNFSHAWIRTFATFAHIFCASVLRDFQQRQFMVTWNDAQASSFHSHGSSFLWLCLSFFPVFHLYWASTFSQTTGGNCASENVSIHFVAKHCKHCSHTIQSILCVFRCHVIQHLKQTMSQRRFWNNVSGGMCHSDIISLIHFRCFTSLSPMTHAH